MKTFALTSFGTLVVVASAATQMAPVPPTVQTDLPSFGCGSGPAALGQIQPDCWHGLVPQCRPIQVMPTHRRVQRPHSAVLPAVSWRTPSARKPDTSGLRRDRSARKRRSNRKDHPETASGYDATGWHPQGLRATRWHHVGRRIGRTY